MIKIEKTLLFIIVLVLLVGAVSATETLREDQASTIDEAVASDISTVSQDNKIINNEEKKVLDENPQKNVEYTTHNIEKKSENNLKKEGIVEVHNYTELQNAVNNTSSTGVDTTIRLLQGSYNNTETITWNTGGMVLTIDGNGQTINGQQQQVFYIDGASMILKNIIITNATSSDGGAIHNFQGTLTVSNSTFNNNQATYEGGAIHNFQGRLTVSNSTFNNNQATDEGGAIHNFQGTLTVSNSTFNNNQATMEGGAINHLHGTLTVSNSTFNNNQAGTGGAILNQGDITVTNSRLINNHATSDGGAIYNYGILPVIGSTLENNTAGKRGGAIHNAYIANIIVSNSSLNNNNATTGGAISLYCGWSSEFAFCNVTNSNFTENHASNGAVIYTINEYVDINVTDTLFARNTADNKETLYINGTKKVNDNTYDSTDILLNKINLAVKDNKNSYTTLEGIVLNFTIELANPSNYDEDILEKLEDITLYINGEKNITTKYENTTIKNLPAGKYEIYYTTCNQKSNTVTFKVMADSQITTPEESYEYYEGINNKIPLHITDPSGEKGTINITIKDQDEYKQLFTYYNIGDGYELPTESLASALKNLYNPLSDSYTINVTYNSDYANPSSTEFTLNINKQRNTTIVYDILNNTEGNVQINITVEDAIYQTPIQDANIQITGDITQNTTTGIITDTTLMPGEYQITVQYPETDDYKESTATINFTVEIDKDAKIAELEGQLENLTEKLEQANEKIENLTNQLEQAKEEIETLNNTIKELTRPPLNTTITITPIRSSVGSIVNLSANVKDQNGEKVSGGKVIFKVNGITLKEEYGNVLYATLTDGCASLKYKVQSVWMKNTSYIEAVYGGNENYTSSRSKSSNILNITEGTAKVSLDKSSFTVKSGEKVTLRAKIVDANGDNINRGKVVFKLNGKTLTDKNGKTLQASVVVGEAVLEYTIPSTYSAKTYNLTAVYGGEGYTRSQTSGKLTINKKGVIINTDSITTKNNKTTIKATIRDETGKLLVRNTSLAIKVNGKTILNGVNSTNGKIDLSFTTTLRPGMYELQIISGENGIYKTGKMTTVLKI